jgi:CheY-like chemotaxis protein/glyoxylase-like metal-dependent hydrolase (beta-lactamase superfamily II)
MQVRFWGTRGSLAKPGPSTLRYGGNTSCVEVTADDGTLVILDCGTGIHGLGQALLAQGRASRGSLLISHTHWDHIQGFPFFTPLFIPGSEWDIYAPRGLGHDVAGALAGQMQYRYFPVNLEQLGATIHYHDLVEGELMLGGIRVVAHYLNHPAVALGYRLEADGSSLVYATDHEPHVVEPNQRPPEFGSVDHVHAQDAAHVGFLAGADLLIHDSQYTEEEYAKKVGWGHSPVERVVDYALMARVKRLALFHYDPLRDDDQVDALVAACQARAAGKIEVFGAAEGQALELEGGEIVSIAERPSARRPHTHEDKLILLVDDDLEIRTLMKDLLSQEGYRLAEASDGPMAIDAIEREKPDLIVLDWSLPGMSGPDVCRAVRRHANPAVAATPIIMLTARSGPDDTRGGFEAGVNDFITKPFTPAHLRARVASWLMRHSPAG